MPAYVILDVKVNDPKTYDLYKQQSGPALEPFGGKFLVRGGEATVLEGGWQPNRVVVLEFPDADSARAWWSSDTYAEPKAIRQSASEGHMILVEGV